ncbi:pseudouridine-5'-phosphate glycosidase [bacterium]|nr:pseudouridine-5'-phosphate glycosidase [bacterium]
MAKKIKKKKNETYFISDEVKEALEESIPVVALESTIISHGMPFPQNVEVALEVEDIIRREGAIPATIAILSGVPCIGLSKDEINTLGKKGQDVVKVSRRDMGVVIARKLDGATTVSSTMICAAMAGIDVFVTGGIGGVHTDVHLSHDISADLREFSRTPVLAVSAGIKSILDIARSAEYLETEGICVLGYGTDEFPAFYTRESGVNIHERVDSVEEIAEIFKAQKIIFPDQGMIVTNPIPIKDQIPQDEINDNIKHALYDCQENGINGKAVTPFLLKRMVELSEGKSLIANIALVKNNALLGAQIAAALLDS